jgi:hypothetical protein
MAKNDIVTRPQLAQRLGVQTYQLAYLIEQGKIPAPAKRPGCKRGGWTRKEAEVISTWFSEHRRISAGCRGEK